MSKALRVVVLVLMPWLLLPFLVARWLLRGREGLARFDDRDVPLMRPRDDVSDAHHEVVARLREGQDGFGGPRTMVDQSERRRRVRAWMDGLGADVEVHGRLVDVDHDGLLGEWVVPEGADGSRRLLYLHGGAFEAGSPTSHRRLTNELASRAGVAVFVVDYRLMPENARRDTIEDSRAAWTYVLEHGPDGRAPAAEAFVAGDSAGANLALTLTQWLRDEGRRLPDGVVVFSPPVDSTFSSPSWRDNIATDPFLGPSFGRLLRVPDEGLVLGTWAVNRIRPDSPLLSPLLGDLSGLPPTLVQASRDEMLFDDAVRYANKARAAGSPVVLQVWPAMVHVWQAFAGLPEAAEALDQVEAFLADPTGFGATAPDATAPASGRSAA